MDPDMEILAQVQTVLDRHGAAKFIQAIGDHYHGVHVTALASGDYVGARDAGRVARICHRAAAEIGLP